MALCLEEAVKDVGKAITERMPKGVRDEGRGAAGLRPVVNGALQLLAPAFRYLRSAHRADPHQSAHCQTDVAREATWQADHARPSAFVLSGVVIGDTLATTRHARFE